MQDYSKYIYIYIYIYIIKHLKKYIYNDGSIWKPSLKNIYNDDHH